MRDLRGHWVVDGDGKRTAGVGRQIHPVVHPGHVRARRRGALDRNDHHRPAHRFRSDPAVDDRWARCGARNLDHDRVVDGFAGDARADDHHGRRAARHGAVLTADRADLPPRQAESIGDRPVRRHVRARHVVDARGAVRGRRTGAGDRHRCRVCVGVDQHRDAGAVRRSHRAVAARVVVDRAGRRRHPTSAR